MSVLKESPTDCIAFRAFNSASSSSRVAAPKAEVSKSPVKPVELPPSTFSRKLDSSSSFSSYIVLGAAGNLYVSSYFISGGLATASNLFCNKVTVSKSSASLACLNTLGIQSVSSVIILTRSCSNSLTDSSSSALRAISIWRSSRAKLDINV